MARLSAKASTLNFVGVSCFFEVFWRFGDGSSDVFAMGEPEPTDGEVAAARCMNFMVRSLEDMTLVAGVAGELAAILRCGRSMVNTAQTSVSPRACARGRRGVVVLVVERRWDEGSESR